MTCRVLKQSMKTGWMLSPICLSGPSYCAFRKSANLSLLKKDCLIHVRFWDMILPSRHCSKTDYMPFSFRVNDIHVVFELSAGRHIPPDGFHLAQDFTPRCFKAGLIQSPTMRASACYMNSSFWNEIYSLLDLTGFMSHENEALRLFQGRSVTCGRLWTLWRHLRPEFIILFPE